MIASFKVQNLLRITEPGADKERYEQVKRAYWAILLLESELQDQLDAARSGIWSYDDDITLPDDRGTWVLDAETGASPAIAITPASLQSAEEEVRTTRTQAYFLAEIAMRRMLHRCNTATKATPDGTVSYAPGVALELQRQLDEWYSYLPDIIRFEHDDQSFDFNLLNSPGGQLTFTEPLSNFLKVQYHCCRLSIYWPAVYQCIQDSSIATMNIVEHAERFFDAYIKLMPALLDAVRNCIVNRWTLCTTVFMTTMTALRGSRTPFLREKCVVDWARLEHCLKAARTVDRDVIEASPSLTAMDNTMASRLNDPIVVPWI
jgi:hypothetical protein